MKTLLTAPDIEYLLTQQEKLDEDIRKKKGISMMQWEINHHNDHQLALMVEVHEFINECHDSWKYWKSKRIDRSKVIDEAVDVIHFAMLLFNKSGDESKVIAEDLIKFDNSHYSTPELLKRMSQGFQVSMILSNLLQVLDRYNFTTSDILDAYNRKNKVNFERLESGY